MALLDLARLDLEDVGQTVLDQREDLGSPHRALFAMGLGMCMPLLVVGMSAGTLLPKSGAWMEAIKKTFCVILLATAVWLVSPVLPVVVQMLAWALLLIVPAVYLHALDPLPPHAKGWRVSGKAWASSCCCSVRRC